jgi:excinuclease UvrABC nuclease subunit
MNAASAKLEFEIAARYRDQIASLKRELREVREAIN